jgi:hypothetical protein
MLGSLYFEGFFGRGCLKGVIALFHGIGWEVGNAWFRGFEKVSLLVIDFVNHSFWFGFLIKFIHVIIFYLFIICFYLFLIVDESHFYELIFYLIMENREFFWLVNFDHVI